MISRKRSLKFRISLVTSHAINRRIEHRALLHFVGAELRSVEYFHIASRVGDAAFQHVSKLPLAIAW
jgi:hypothetical protein